MVKNLNNISVFFVYMCACVPLGGGGRAATETRRDQLILGTTVSGVNELPKMDGCWELQGP